MGCKISTQQQTTPIRPSQKARKHQNNSIRVIAPQFQPASPQHDRLEVFQDKKFDGENSTGSVESRKSFGNLDSGKPEGTFRDKTYSPMIRIIGIGSSRASSEDSIKRSDSLDVSPNMGRSPKKDFTFHYAENSSNDSLSTRNGQFNRFLSINPRPSEFYMQKILGDKNLVKLSTIGAPNSTEDVKFENDMTITKKTIIKSMGEIHGGSRSSLHTVDHEIMPDTPGFRSIGSNLGSQLGFLLEEQKEENYYSKSSFQKKRSESKIEDDLPVKMSPELLAIPEGVILEKETDLSNIEQGKQQRSIYRTMESSEMIIQNSNRTPTQQNYKSQVIDQEQQPDDLHISTVSSVARRKSPAVRHQITITLEKDNESEKNEEGIEKRQRRPQEERKKAIVQQRFTQNLLDLVTIQKKDPIGSLRPSKKQSSGGSKTPKKVLADTSEDGNTMSLSLASSHLMSSEPLKKTKPVAKDEQKNKQQTPLESPHQEQKQERMAPLKLGTIEFLQNGEMVSPICNPKSENVTPPFSNRTFILKNFLGSGDCLDERTITNMEFLSRGDFDKYSFVAEVKEVEVYQNTSHDSEPKQRERRESKRATFANFKTLGSQDLFSDEIGKRAIGTFLSDEKYERKFGTNEEMEEIYETKEYE